MNLILKLYPFPRAICEKCGYTKKISLHALATAPKVWMTGDIVCECPKCPRATP